MADRVIGLFGLTGIATFFYCWIYEPFGIASVLPGTAAWLLAWVGLYSLYKVFGGKNF